MNWDQIGLVTIAIEGLRRLARITTPEQAAEMRGLQHAKLNVSKFGYLLSSSWKNAYYMRRRKFHDNQSALQIFYDLASFHATDPRDRIYAMLGMPSFRKDSLKVVVDYSKSVLEVYRDFTVAAIYHYGALDVLSLVYKPPPDQEAWPSWIPSFNDMPLTLGAFGFTELFTAGILGAQACRLKFSLDSLAIQGCRFDAVLEHEALFGAELVKQKIDQLWRDKFKKRLLRTPQTYPTGELNSTAFAMTLVGGAYSNNTKECLEEFTAFIDHTLPGDIHLDGPQSDRKAAARGLKYGNRILADRRSFFQTTQGYLGLGPDTLQTGDVVCILFGGRCPFVLRPKEGFYQLIGEAYVHGIMYGEALAMLQSGLLDTQMFTLR
jgi:hypothetical protein